MGSGGQEEAGAIASEEVDESESFQYFFLFNNWLLPPLSGGGVAPAGLCDGLLGGEQQVRSMSQNPNSLKNPNCLNLNSRLQLVISSLRGDGIDPDELLSR